jgi:hypothetical protein
MFTGERPYFTVPCATVVVFTIKFTVKAAVFGRTLLHRQITAAIVRYRFVGNRSSDTVQETQQRSFPRWSYIRIVTSEIEPAAGRGYFSGKKRFTPSESML